MEEKLHTLEKEMIDPTTYWDLFSSVWHFEVFAVEGQGITIGKITIGLVLLSLGYLASKLVSRTVHRRVLSRLQIESSLQFTLQTIIFYICFLLVCLFVLQLLSIPITVFAVLGGAVAIGLGFGSQNLISNFISGLIVMVERPVRVGDMVEVEGHTGRVEDIGTRCTIIRTADSREVIIPNSKFLDQTFINWTLSDSLVMNKVAVGVAYNSNIQLVRELLIRAASENPRILKSHPVLVQLINFGDSSLDMEVSFWQRVDPDYGPAAIRSDIRFKILELFEAHKVSIPFPHREVIMHTHEPRP